MAKVNRYIRNILAILGLLILLVMVLLNTPFVQRRTAVIVSSSLENRLGTRVDIGGMHWRIPDNIVLDSLRIEDREGETLLSAERVAAKVEWMPLIRDKVIYVRNVRLFGPSVNVYADSVGAEPNYQFVIDSFRRERTDSTSATIPSLRINSLIVRDAALNYNILNEPATPGVFNAKHIGISHLNTHLSLRALDADSLSLMVRQLSVKEQSGFALDDLNFRVVANREGATVVDVNLGLPESRLRIDTLRADYSSGLLLQGRVLPSTIVPSELAAFVPGLAGVESPIFVSTTFKGNAQQFEVPHLSLSLGKRDVDMLLTGEANLRPDADRHVKGYLHRLSVTENGWSAVGVLAESLADAFAQQSSTADVAEDPSLRETIAVWAKRVGTTSVTGSFDASDRVAKVDASVRTAAGAADVKAQLMDDNYTAMVGTRALNVGRLAEVPDLGALTATLNSIGTLDLKSRKIKQASVEGTVGELTYKEYPYHGLELGGLWNDDKLNVRLSSLDPNAKLSLLADYDMSDNRQKNGHVALTVPRFSPHGTHLTDSYEDTDFAFRLNAAFKGSNVDDMRGKLSIDSFVVARPDHSWTVKNFTFQSMPEGGNKLYTIASDFIEGHATGYFTLGTLGGSLYNLLGDYEGTLLSSLFPKGERAARQADRRAKDGEANVFSFNLSVMDLAPLRELLDVPVHSTSPINLSGYLFEDEEKIELTANVPQLTYDDTRLRDVTLTFGNAGGSLTLTGGGKLTAQDGSYFTANVRAGMADNNVNLALGWNNSVKDFFEGELTASAHFEKNAAGKLQVYLNGHPAQAVLGGETWSLDSFMAMLSGEEYAVKGFNLNNGMQQLALDGSVQVHPEASDVKDSLSLRMNDIDLTSLVALTKMKGITFGGRITGSAGVAGLFSKAPHIKAQMAIDSLVFCDGQLGDALASVGYNEQGIVFDVKAPETNITGLASVADKQLDMNIGANGTDIHFLNTLLMGILSDIDGRAYGNLRVFGNFNHLQLAGNLLANDASFTLVPTGVPYHFNDYIHFDSDAIRFDDVVVYDAEYDVRSAANGQPGALPHTAVLNGAVKHSGLKNWSYDLKVKANDVLGLNIEDNGISTFHTTIYAKGDVHVYGADWLPLRVDVDARTVSGSFFALNIGGGAEGNSDFITYRDRDVVNARAEQLQTQFATLAQRGVRRQGTGERMARRRRRQPDAAPQELLVSVHASVTPDAKIQLVMDPTTDDNVSAYGSGNLDIRITNNDVNLYGTYAISRGYYRLNIQELLYKDFEIVNGSTISFDGDPMESRLSITAQHAVASASLVDLSADAAAMGNVRVNCLLGISGTPNAPQLKFGLELPQGTEEQRTLLRSYTATDEQMNLQFIYLLGLGKFYTYDYSQTTQGTQGGVSAMESLLSSTISGQINNLVANLLPSENWNLSGNIRSDNILGNYADEELFNNMEVQGVLEGRLLNNRLLVNGNFGYRDNPMYASNFIGDFDIRYLVGPRSNLWLKGYNKTNDRYFSRTALTTQGIGLMFSKEFDHIKKKKEQPLAENEPEEPLPADTVAVETTVIEPTDSSEPE